MQSIVFQPRHPQKENAEEAEEEDEEVLITSSESSVDGVPGEDYIEFLDEFVVPDDTVEYSDGAASPPTSPFGVNEMWRRRRAAAQEQRDMDVDDGLSSRLC